LSRADCCNPRWLSRLGAFDVYGRVWGLLYFADNVTSCPYRTTIIEVRLFYSFALSVGLLAAQGTDMSELKRMEVERLRVMAETGSVPRARLEQAQAELADSEDNAILRRTLYGSLRIEDFTKEQSDLMVAAATRLVERQNERYERTKQLVAEGIVARAALTTMLEDLDYRKKALDLANFRAKLVEDLSEQALAEGGVDETGPVLRMGRIIERYDGAGAFREADFLRINTAFMRQFGKSLPVSAKGDTALHRSLGFDHRGRVDIALNPDQREGSWLRSYMQKAKLPYYAFRAAVRGKATAPHIHMGPPSTRYRVAD
jgi:hypothetical protein